LLYLLYFNRIVRNQKILQGVANNRRWSTISGKNAQIINKKYSQFFAANQPNGTPSPAAGQSIL